MKLCFVIIFLISFSVSNAQLEGPVIYAEKKSLRDVKNIVIADMAIIPGLRPAVYLKSCSRQKDSTGNYATEFVFRKPSHSATDNVQLILQFYKPVDTVYFSTEGEALEISTTFDKHTSGASFTTSRLDADAAIIIKVMSKTKNFITITGIAGQYPTIKSPQ